MQDVIIERDNTKIQLCSENGVRLLHFGNPENFDDELGYEMITDDDRLIHCIQSVEEDITLVVE